MEMIIDVSIIVVNYNTKELTRNCLKSVFEQTDGIVFEVIVSDNGSTDGSLEMIRAEFPEVILIENGANIGFGAANNRALAVARGKYVFYLNSDTVLLNNAVKMFFDYWENSPEKESIGALGGVLLNENMETIHSGGQFPTYTRMLAMQMLFICSHLLKTVLRLIGLQGLWERRRRNECVVIPVGETGGYITGADLFMRNNEYAYFDENYFMYYEESDMELQLAKLGMSRFIIDGPRIQHLSNKSSGRNFIVSFFQVCMQDSSVYYARKNLGTNAVLLKLLIWLDRLHPSVARVARSVPWNAAKKLFD